MGQGNIHGFLLSCKNLGNDLLHEWGLYVAVLLLGLASFGLGRLSALESLKQPVSVAQTASVGAVRPLNIGGMFVASRTGTVYYFPWCGSVENIEPMNQIWFKNEEAAKSAGYRPAKNCKGLSSN